MPKFQIHDTVVLRQSPTFVGLVERTSQIESEPLEDCLIVAHTEVPTILLDQFIKSGTPPTGYVFVQFTSQEKGSSLVAEDDLHLIDRMLELGDVVKNTDSVAMGTVVNVSASYVLDPVWKVQTSASTDFPAKATDRSTLQESACDRGCHFLDPHIQHVCPSRLIPNVPFTELKRAQDFMEGDYVLHQDWLGVIGDVELLVIIMLSDGSIVAVEDPEQLKIPIPDYEKRIVYMPEFDGLMRPPYVESMLGHGHLIPPEDLEIGQYVVTARRNVSNGRYLRGSYDPSVSPEGYVLLVRCSEVGVHWLICNAYTPTTQWQHVKPPEEIAPYENIRSFPDPTELRRNRSINLYDPGKHSATVQDRTRTRRQGWLNVDITRPVKVSSSFNIGDQVKFRDPAGAAVKYHTRNTDGELHHSFERILHTDTLGYDLNEFEIVQSSQKVIVRWQDGTESEHNSVSLTKVNLFEADLMPGDIVVARDGMKQQPERKFGAAHEQHPTDFNEMTYFEKPQDLLPVKVGIIQYVFATDKVAKVRWFSSPIIRITRFGNALSPDSRFGPIADNIEEVSLYEVMTFPALVRKARDIVLISPSKPSEAAFSIFAALEDEAAVESDAQITAFSQIPDRSAGPLLSWMQRIAKQVCVGEDMALVEVAKYKAHRSIDWAGEIAQILLDGSIVVRTNNQDSAQDVLLDHDQILAFVDTNPIWGMDHSEDPMDLDSSEISDFSENDDLEEVIAEEVEYEGGQRLDEDSGDDNWESDDEADVQQDVVLVPPQGQTSAAVAPPLASPVIAVSRSDAAREQVSVSISSYLPVDEPQNFQVLDIEPPSDQFRADAKPNLPSSILKRIAKEHRMLASGLPTQEIYVRTYESRLDLLRCLIIGPENTPYENAPFLIDLHLGTNFPKEPPTAYFHSWTSGMGRINPNLYEEGKICLSLLGTWPGKSETESWSPKATLLQLLVSLQGLVFVREPFYNEAGFEGYESSREYTNESLMFSEKAYVMARNFIRYALASPVPGLEDVLAWTYLPKTVTLSGEVSNGKGEGMLKRAIVRSRSLMRRSDELREHQQPKGDNHADLLLSGDGQDADVTKTFLRPMTRGACVMLNKSLQLLEEIGAQHRIEQSHD